jgi:glycosyltransferase involved in cell wall biosynthesis
MSESIPTASLEATRQSFDEILHAQVYNTPSLPPLAPDRSDKYLTLFVACYNEEENIIASLEAIAAAVARFSWTWEVIVIDDASTDHSVPLIKEYMCSHPEYPILLVVREINQGLAQNYIEASFLGRGKYFKLVCGDNVETSQQLIDLFKRIGEADLLIPYHIDTSSRSLFRRSLSRLFTITVNLISGYNIGYYNGNGVQLRYSIMRLNTNFRGFDYQADLILRQLEQGRTYVQIPVVAGERAAGKSKAISLKNICSVLHFFVNIAIRRFGRSSRMRQQRVPAASNE